MKLSDNEKQTRKQLKQNTVSKELFKKI